MRQTDKNPYLQLKGIDKFFGITKALQGVDFDIYPGEVIGLVGPNGAGKSTLMKVITGVLEPTNGSLWVQGQEAPRYTTREAKAIGISCAYQDLSLCTNLRVYENFAMLNVSHSLFEKPGWRKQRQKEADALLTKYFPGSGIDVMQQVNHLTLAERQIVEICKTLMAENLRILVLDEPTSALSTDKAQQLHEVVRSLAAQGVAIIYISHKLDEIKQICNRIVVMRNGQITGECLPEETSQDELLQMLGGEITERALRQETPVAENAVPMVQTSSLSTNGLQNVTMHLNKGEILGISGLVGSGQETLLNAIFDAGKKGKKGGVVVNGTVSYVSGDRAKEGVFPLWSIFDNILIASLDKVRKGPLLNQKESEGLAQHWYDKLKFKAEGVHSPITSLSGGNQQKALIARGIASGADVIILNDPTAGVDIETKQEIYALLHEAKAEGRSIILYSTEDAEIEICDRAYIMHEGAITKELTGNEITVPNIVRASFIKVEKQQAAERKKQGVFAQFMRSRMVLPLATLLAMVIINAVINPNIMSYSSVRMLVGSAVPLVFAALGQMFIVVAGDIDMGNGYSIGLVNVLVAVVLTGNPLMGVISLILFIAAYVGMGALIHLRRIPSIVVTLGAQFIWLGIALVISPTPGGYSPAWLNFIYQLRFWLIPSPVIICVLAALFSWFVLYRSKYGMILRGIGNNPVAVERSGWSYLRAKMANYGLSGLMVVLAGLTFTAVCLGSDANSASSYCMLSIATVIIGGCDMSGGIVEPVGVVAGGIAMSLITTLLTFLKVGSNYQTAVTGLVLILVLVIKLFTANRKEVRA